MGKPKVSIYLRIRKPDGSQPYCRTVWETKKPEAYTQQELEDLFRMSSEEDKLLWRFFLGTGFRDRGLTLRLVQ